MACAHEVSGKALWTGPDCTETSVPWQARRQTRNPHARWSLHSTPASVRNTGGHSDLHQELRGIQHHLYRRAGRFVGGEIFAILFVIGRQVLALGQMRGY